MAFFLAEQKHDVRVTSTFSYYPAWKLQPEDRGVSVRDDVVGGIPVRRVAMHVPIRPTAKGRLLSDVSFLRSLLLRGRHRGWVPDLVITALPMLSQCLAQRFLYATRRIPRVIIVQDFVVEAALELGILRVPVLSRFLKSVQRWALRSAQTIITISPAMLEKLDQSVGPDRRTVLIPNWIHRSLQSEIDRQLVRKPNRSASTLFYSGNLGIKQGLPDFVKSFISHDSGWRLKIRGGGAEVASLRAIISTAKNVDLGGVLSEEEYIRELLSATLCLVTQRPNVGANFLPSKLLPALATGTPVLAVCPKDSPLAREVLEGEFGQVVEPEKFNEVRDCLARLQNDPSLLAQYSLNALKRAERYDRSRILSQYQNELFSLVNRGHASGVQMPQSA